MARKHTPDKPGGNAAGNGGSSDEAGDLDDRRKALDAALSARTASGGRVARDRGTGYANAFRLSSEFIAGVLVGAGLGYLIDRLAGTAPWGMIVFLLLGFAAGVVNVLRSAGLMAEAEKRTDPDYKPDDKKD